MELGPLVALGTLLLAITTSVCLFAYRYPRAYRSFYPIIAGSVALTAVYHVGWNIAFGRAIVVIQPALSPEAFQSARAALEAGMFNLKLTLSVQGFILFVATALLGLKQSLKADEDARKG